MRKERWDKNEGKEDKVRDEGWDVRSLQNKMEVDQGTIIQEAG